MKPSILLVIAVLLGLSVAVVAFTAPQNFPLVAYKIMLSTIGALLGWIINEAFLHIDDEKAQAILIGATMLALTVGV